MKTLKQLRERVTIDTGTPEFDFNTKATSKGETDVNTRLGKTGFIPYEKTINSVLKRRAYSVYSIGGTTSKSAGHLFMRMVKKMEKTDGYKKFINRTAVFIAGQIVKKNKIDFIIAPKSSSSLVDDVLKSVQSKTGVKVLSHGFEKADISKITIDYKHPKITDKISKRLESNIRKAKKDGLFEMKTILPNFRKFIKNYLKLVPNDSLRKNIEGKNVMIFDDIVTSGTTIEEMIRSVELYAPNKIIAGTILKHK